MAAGNLDSVLGAMRSVSTAEGFKLCSLMECRQCDDDANFLSNMEMQSFSKVSSNEPMGHLRVLSSILHSTLAIPEYYRL